MMAGGDAGRSGEGASSMEKNASDFQENLLQGSGRLEQGGILAHFLVRCFEVLWRFVRFKWK